MHSRRKLHIVVVCVLFILASFLSSLFVSEHADHQCGDEHCGICLHITQFNRALKELRAAAVPAALLALAVLIGALCATYGGRRISTAAVTPVTLKVQMNH